MKYYFPKKKDNDDNIDDFDQHENNLETTEYEFEDEYDVDEAIWDLSLNGYARGGFSARSGIQSRYVKIKLLFKISKILP